MAEKKHKITLIGTEIAREGVEFVYEGAAAACSGCSVEKACNNLKAGRRYQITGVRTTRHPCQVHVNGACAVEVEEARIPTLITAEMAIKNSRIRFSPTCSKEECCSFLLCNPDGVLEGESYMVSNVLGNAPEPCDKGRTLKLVELRPV